MSLSIWFKSDLGNIIASQARAVGQTPVSPEYWRGYQDAIVNLAVALGITLEMPKRTPWQLQRPLELEERMYDR